MRHRARGAADRGSAGTSTLPIEHGRVKAIVSAVPDRRATRTGSTETTGRGENADRGVHAAGRTQSGHQTIFPIALAAPLLPRQPSGIVREHLIQNLLELLGLR